MLFRCINQFLSEYIIDLMIDIKQQMLIVKGYPKNAITKPIMKSMNGTTNAFFTAKASDRYSW